MGTGWLKLSRGWKVLHFLPGKNISFKIVICPWRRSGLLSPWCCKIDDTVTSLIINIINISARLRFKALISTGSSSFYVSAPVTLSELFIKPPRTNAIRHQQLRFITCFPSVSCPEKPFLISFWFFFVRYTNRPTNRPTNPAIWRPNMPVKDDLHSGADSFLLHKCPHRCRH